MRYLWTWGLKHKIPLSPLIQLLLTVCQAYMSLTAVKVTQNRHSQTESYPQVSHLIDYKSLTPVIYGP